MCFNVNRNELLFIVEGINGFWMTDYVQNGQIFTKKSDRRSHPIYALLKRNVCWKLILNGSNLNGCNRGRREKEKKKEEEEKELVRRRGGWKMLGFYLSVYFTVCTSELLTNQTPFRATQIKILQNVREVTVYLNYLFVCFFHYICILWLGMTLRDLTTQCGNAQEANREEPTTRFLLLRVVRKLDGRYELFYHWRGFGSEYLNAGKYSNIRKLIKRWNVFISDLGRHLDA